MAGFGLAAMLTVSGLLLGAVLTTPAAAASGGSDGALANPFAHRGSTGGPDVALGLRDPFDPATANAIARGDTERGDLRDPFGRSHRSRMAGPAQPMPADLRSPFEVAPTGSAAARPHETTDLRDPFDR